MTNLSEEQKETEMAENKTVTNKELEIAVFAWKCFLGAHADECDTNAFVDEVVKETASIKDKECEEKLAKCRAETIKEMMNWFRNNKDYKIMARLVAGGYRNMTYDSDYELLLKDMARQPAR